MSAFAGKTALVTGGARGIGRAAVLRLASEGAAVAINFVSKEPAARDTQAAIARFGVRSAIVQGDVSLPDDARRIASETRKALGPIDILVHSAGISIVQPADAVTWETWRRIMSVNLDGTFNMVYAVKDEMIERKFGRIVNLSSLAALRPRQNQVHYSTAKAGVIAFTRCCAEAWAKHNIRINAIAPGLIDTEMVYELPKELRDAAIAGTPLGRMGTADEIANVIRFLVSEESSFMTGQCLAVSGGRVMLPT
jgi:3-oxoacyl-[acyl-carrier protein] reductase